MRRFSDSSRLLGAFLFFLLLGAGTARAQYFGQNKVQWESFDFKVLHTRHFDIYYYDQERDVVDDVGRMAERWYGRLSGVFGVQFDKKPIVLYANSADFQQTTTTPEMIGEGTGGFTDEFMNRVVLPLTGDYAENDHVLGHELVHVFQYQTVATRGRSGNERTFALEQLPLWLVEGMAEYFSKGRFDPLTAMWIRDATLHKHMPDFRKLTYDPRFFPYRYGEALLAYMGGRWGDDQVLRYFRAAGSVGPEEAFRRVFGLTAKEMFEQWRTASEQFYGPVTAARTDTLGKPLVSSQRRGDLNIGPAISPDGRWIAFLSSRNLVSIDLFLADAQTGRITRTLVSSGSDAHFNALRFIDSAGSWSPDSKQLAFVVFERGGNRLAVLDIGSGRVDRIAIPGIDALSNASWSPDGHTIAFAGQATGVTDLCTYDMNTKQVRQLTNDKYADLQPAWSPDGRTIAWATDRGAETDFAQLKYGDLQIATIDANGGTPRLLPLFAHAKQINPQFSPDGKSIYFISNPDGIPDIYRYDLTSGAITRITHVPTGVAGITDSSPALSVASQSGQVSFSLYDNDSYRVYQLPPSAGQSVAAADVISRNAGLLPPLNPVAPSETTSYLSRPNEGLLPPDANFSTSTYNSGFHLSYLGPAQIGVSSGRYGTFSGAITAYFSDMLGRQNIGVTLESASGGSNVSEALGGEVFYLNQQRRFNWGGSATHIPYVSATQPYAYTTTVNIDGQPVLADVVEQRRDVVLFDQASAIAQYPFGVTRRIEADFGFQRNSFRSEVEQAVFVGGQLVSNRTFNVEQPLSLSFQRGAVAFVGDSTQFGIFSPVRGTRYRYEAGFMTGDLNFETALADWRKYFFHRPYSFAIRAMHYGRYGSDAEDPLISPLFLGDSSLVRGYDSGSFDLSECGNQPQGSSACPAFDRLIGSRLLVANAEFRVPLFGPQGFGVISGAFIPTELVAFADAGTAWTSEESTKWQWSRRSDAREPVASVGAAVRILLGYIPLEFYWAKPLQRPGKGLVFGFDIRPGW